MCSYQQIYGNAVTLFVAGIEQQSHSEVAYRVAGPSTGAKFHQAGSSGVEGIFPLSGTFPGPQALSFDFGGVVYPPRSPVVLFKKNFMVPNDVLVPFELGYA